MRTSDFGHLSCRGIYGIARYFSAHVIDERKLQPYHAKEADAVAYTVGISRFEHNILPAAAVREAPTDPITI